VLPGRTVAVLYLAQYEQSPVGAYHEVIIAPAITRTGGTWAFWISHIVVDSDPSVAAGRSIWNLPKQVGSFVWQGDSSVHVDMRSSQLTVSMLANRPRGLLRLPFTGPAMSGPSSAIMRFFASGNAKIGLATASVELRGNANLQRLGFGPRQTLYAMRDMHLKIGEPKSLP
jgi:hypothetical protein